MSRLGCRRLAPLVASALALATGCDLVRGPTPLNDAPVIRQLNDYSFVDANNNVVQTIAALDLIANEQTEWALDVVEPEGEPLTITVGPLPRGWWYDAERRVLVAAPDHRQRNLAFTIYIVAEDSHDPPAYDTRVLTFSVH
jgi:hypothetical protein